VGQPAGISATVLARRAVAQVGHSSARPLTDRELSRWLVEQQFAERGEDGRLRVTKHGASIGGSLRPFERA